MAYNVRVTDEAFRPIKATVVYSDLNGKVTGSEVIPISASEYTLSDTLLQDAFTVTFTAPGYYDFDVDKYHLADSSDITLQAKPTETLAIVGGIAVLGIVALFFKKAL